MSVRSHTPAPLDPGRIWRRSEPQTSTGPPEHRNPRRATTTTPPEKSRGESQGSHPEATVQMPQEAAATSPQAPPAAVCARADPAMDPETRDPGHITPQAEARQSPGVQAPASSHRE
ncbi:hypothetical protein ATANTOWER_018024 [Ataeniobius toweri]|uniref:Uncharacterized protein n=1 Tax=Ataeniobius toweri TaxID=208326 RepID=A0ABU7BZY7_9TELE|nr:hypothetical protein [Ataeniobius toweri]